MNHGNGGFRGAGAARASAPQDSAAVDFHELYDIAESLYSEDQGRPGVWIKWSYQDGADWASVRAAPFGAQGGSVAGCSLSMVFEVSLAGDDAPLLHCEL